MSRKSMNRKLAAGLLAAGIFYAEGALTQQLSFTFVAPTGTIVSNFGEANAVGGYVNGYRGVRLTAANEATFRSVAPPNVIRTFDSLVSGTTLRNRVDRVMQISGGKVDIDVLLVDDRTSLGNHQGLFATVVRDGKRIVWPAASVSQHCSTNDYCGLIRLGEEGSIGIQGRPGGWLAWESTILHESFHTQFVDDKTKWSSILITYGGDHSHWRSELLGDQAIPFEEGFGTFFGSVHNPAGMTDIVRWFNRTNERYALESRSVLAGTSALWNSPHVEEERDIPETASQSGRYVVRFYKWRDVPGYYLLFSESTSTMLHGMFWKYANNDPDNAFNMIHASASSIMWRLRTKRDLMFAVNRLAQELEVYAGTAQGQAARRAGTLTSGMFPFALLDILTHYGMTETRFREVYNRATSGRQPRSYEAYWEHRERVKARVERHLRTSSIDIEGAVQEANRYFQQAETILLSPLVSP